MNLEQKERRTQGNIRAIYDLTMGVLWIVAGLFFIFDRKLGFEFPFDPLMAGIFGVTCIGYASFRLYRGYKSRKGI